MRKILTALNLCMVSVCTVLSILSVATADGLFMRLPADGTSAKYAMEASVSGQNQTGEMTIKSVGKETADGTECRWIEIIMDGQGRKGVFKMLIPEADLKAGGSPWKNAKKIYIDPGNGTAEELPNPESPFLGPIMAILGGPMEDAKELAAEKVSTDAGEFECAGVKGSYQFDLGAAAFAVHVENRYTDGEKAGFGCVNFQLKFQMSEIAEGTASFRLKEVGAGAKSELDHSKAGG